MSIILSGKYKYLAMYGARKMFHEDSVASHPPTTHMWQTGDGIINQNQITIAGWNVNGLKAIYEKGELVNFINKFKPDMFCINQTKINLKKYEQSIKGKIFFKEYYQFWNFCKISAGYSGVSVYSKFKPIRVIEDFPDLQVHNLQGRLIALQFDKFYLLNVYKPNAGKALERLDYSLQYDSVFNQYVKKLKQTKPVIVFGDFNAAHNQLDLANPKRNKNKAGFLDVQRQKISQLVQLNLVDAYRLLNPEGQKYTYWSYIFQARPKNIGWRIDYIFVDARLKSIKADVHDDIMGSDHCPVSVTIQLA